MAKTNLTFQNVNGRIEASFIANEPFTLHLEQFGAYAYLEQKTSGDEYAFVRDSKRDKSPYEETYSPSIFPVNIKVVCEKMPVNAAYSTNG